MNHILTPEVLHALYPYQIETIKRQVRDYINVNQSLKKLSLMFAQNVERFSLVSLRAVKQIQES